MVNYLKKRIIIRYAGGLGNQMFQYALRCYFECKGMVVKDDISYYDNTPNAMPFVLEHVFPNIKLARATDEEKEKYLRLNRSKNVYKKIYNKLFPVRKKHYIETKELQFDTSLLQKKEGYFSGYWQSYKYVELVRCQIEEKFKFGEIYDEDIEKIVYRMSGENTVSVHIRAGDYLLPQNSAIFGGICTLGYYQRAIDTMCKRIKNPLFFVFSNDMNWCKENILLDNVVWMDEKILPEHEDWIEMYLMSCCGNNIIANSSFSWWAAWLNKNPKKIVVAPIKWLQTIDRDEICPKEWIRM